MARNLVLVSVAFVLSACASKYRDIEDTLVQIPQQWQVDTNTAADLQTWSQILSSEELEEQLRYAITNSPALKQRELDVAIAQAGLSQSKLEFWPSLDLSLGATRSGTQVDGGGSSGIGNQFSFSASMDYELNLWGQLSDAKKANGFAFSAALADYDGARRDLVEQISNAWLDVVEAQQLVALYSKRLDSLQKNLNIIESGYRSGLNNALEVYLARNDVERERSRLVLQEQSLSDSRRKLARLSGDYPDNTRQSAAKFPQTKALAAPEIPSELLSQRSDIQASWLRVLRQNAELAIAHKSRFPSLRLSARSGVSEGEFSDLSSGDITWSLGASLLQPLLNAGRLKSAEQIAKFRLQQSEQSYLATVYSAFQEVEIALEKQEKLVAQFGYTEQAEANALQAETLAFDQYLRGIASYSTVLESQRRAVDAQISLISLKKQMISNRINLLNAVQGRLDFIASNN